MEGIVKTQEEVRSISGLDHHTADKIEASQSVDGAVSSKGLVQ